MSNRLGLETREIPPTTPAFRTPRPSHGLRFVLMCAVAVTLGCATTSRRAQTERESRNTVLTEDIYLAGGATALDGVELLAPNYQHRLAGSARAGSRAYPIVYLDGLRVDRVETLRAIPASSIRSIQYMDGMSAVLRYGSDHGGGAIIVLTMTRW